MGFLFRVAKVSILKNVRFCSHENINFFNNVNVSNT